MDNNHVSETMTQTFNPAQLIAQVLRTKSQGVEPLEAANNLLARFNNLVSIARAGIAELCEVRGITKQKAVALQAGLQLGKHMATKDFYRGKSFTSSYAVFEAYGPKLGTLEHETFWVLLLDGKNRVLNEVKIAQGSTTRCPVTPQDVFAPALREKAVRMILIHNHPSSNPEPSADDRALTERLQQIAQLLGLDILDHVIVGTEGYVSFADRGWL